MSNATTNQVSKQRASSQRPKRRSPNTPQSEWLLEWVSVIIIAPALVYSVMSLQQLPV